MSGRSVRLLRLAAIALLLGSLYYLLLARPMTARIAALEAETAAVEAERAAWEARGEGMETMRRALAEQGPGETVPLAPPGSQPGMMALLNDCLADLPNYNLRFSQPETFDGVLRRRVWLDFTAGDYPQAANVLAALRAYPYRLSFGELAIASPEGDLGKGPLSLSLEVSFYEEAGPSE